MGSAIGAGASRGSSSGSSRGGGPALSAPPAAAVAWCLLCHLALWPPAWRCGCDNGTFDAVDIEDTADTADSGDTVAAAAAKAEERLKLLFRTIFGVAPCCLRRGEIGGRTHLLLALVM